MATKGIHGPGFLVKVGTTHADVVTLAYLRETKGPTLAVESEDVTTQESTDYTREKDPALIDSGTISGQLIYRPENATQASYLAHLQARDIVYIELYNNPPTNSMYFSGNAFASKFDVTGPIGNSQTADVEFTITGKATQH